MISSSFSCSTILLALASISCIKSEVFDRALLRLAAVCASLSSLSFFLYRLRLKRKHLSASSIIIAPFLPKSFLIPDAAGCTRTSVIFLSKHSGIMISPKKIVTKFLSKTISHLCDRIIGLTALMFSTTTLLLSLSISFVIGGAASYVNENWIARDIWKDKKLDTR